ncbi:MAG: YqgE/AlgH family protein [Actinobacteria bacterium]|nr:YqgE/AlgH family protein [Actinomycetota bacterium]MBW3649149.1 YqgE/AlgH family protein [Actinomycetota bacterium]
MDSLLPAPGRLLVATPALEDPNFHRTVVLVLAFGAEGALGVVLNRPNEVPVAAVLPGWEELAAEPTSMFVGGPVGRSSVICVGRLSGADAAGVPGCQPVAGQIATVDLNLQPADVAPAVEALRLFSGYSGWDGGQLEAELQVGSWFVVRSQLDDVFGPDPEGLWRRVLRRQGGRLSLYANAPPKLSLN